MVFLRLLWLMTSALCFVACSPVSMTQPQEPTPAGSQALSSRLLSQEPSGQVAFASNRTGDYLAYTFSLETETLRDWCPSGQICTQPVWHPSGQQVALIASQQNTYQLQQLTLATGSFETLLTSQTPLGSPQWSPDGTRLALQAGAAGAETIQTLEPGQSPQILGPGRFPRWSPDSRQVLFLQKNQQICRQALNAASPTCLTPSSEADFYPRWSPDGKQIAYLTRQGDSWHLALMQADGSQRRVLLSDLPAQTPAWSPDGQYLAFVVPGRFEGSGDNAPRSDPRQEIWIMPWQDPAARQRLTQGAGDTLPLWTPDGDWLIFQSSRSGRSALYRIRVDGESEAPLVAGTGTDLLGDVN